MKYYQYTIPHVYSRISFRNNFCSILVLAGKEVLYKLTNGSNTYAGSGPEMYNGFLK